MEELSIHREVDQFRTTAAAYLTQKEEEFLSSLSAYAQTKGRITEGQNNWYQSLRQKYSPESLAEKALWDQQFNNQHRLIAHRVADYYEANPPYFSDIVNRIKGDPDHFKMSLAEWKRFCENKYAQKVLSEYETEEKFQKGQCVQIRASNRIDVANAEGHPRRSARRSNANKIGFVLGVNSKPITRAAKGSRIYQILLTGECSPIYAHESDLKKARGKLK